MPTNISQPQKDIRVSQAQIRVHLRDLCALKKTDPPTFSRFSFGIEVEREREVAILRYKVK
jgi:hypothetical protein